MTRQKIDSMLTRSSRIPASVSLGAQITPMGVMGAMNPFGVHLSRRLIVGDVKGRHDAWFVAREMSKNSDPSRRNPFSGDKSNLKMKIQREADADRFPKGSIGFLHHFMGDSDSDCEQDSLGDPPAPQGGAKVDALPMGVEEDGNPMGIWEKIQEASRMTEADLKKDHSLKKRQSDRVKKTPDIYEVVHQAPVSSSKKRRAGTDAGSTSGFKRKAIVGIRRDTILFDQSHACSICKSRFEHSSDITVDHIVCEQFKGMNGLTEEMIDCRENLHAICGKCNHVKTYVVDKILGKMICSKKQLNQKIVLAILRKECLKHYGNSYIPGTRHCDGEDGDDDASCDQSAGSPRASSRSARTESEKFALKAQRGAGGSQMASLPKERLLREKPSNGFHSSMVKLTIGTHTIHISPGSEIFIDNAL